MTTAYAIVMFAYNEEKNIEHSIKSVFKNITQQCESVFVIANGCTDNTVEVLDKLKINKHYCRLNIINIQLGDKCNAWNTYMHDIAPDVDVHFFIDADVTFTENCFAKMVDRLTSDISPIAIAGMPQSGRNMDTYRELVINRACVFGNLYGLKHAFIQRIREANFRLPVGLNWIDSFITKAINTDLQFFDYNLPNRTCYIEDVGYHFDSLSPFKRDDLKLYFNRIARYELGKLQEFCLDDIDINEWPMNMSSINEEIRDNFESLTKDLSYFKRFLAKKRLAKLFNA